MAAVSTFAVLAGSSLAAAQASPATSPRAHHPATARVVATAHHDDAAAGESTAMVSVSSDGVPSNNEFDIGDSLFAQPSANGTVVAFYSSDYTLDPTVPPPSNPADGGGGIYVRNTVSGVTARVDRFPGDLGPMEPNTFQLSEDGRWIDYVESVSSAPTAENPYPYHREAYLQDLSTGTRVRISSAVPEDAADADIDNIVLSANGETAAFWGYSGPADNWHRSLWIYDRSTGVLRDAFQSTDGGDPQLGGDAPFSISGDGSTIAFKTDVFTLKTDPQVAPNSGWHMYVMSTAPGALPSEVMTPSGAQEDVSSALVEHSLSFDGSILEFASESTNWTSVPPAHSEDGTDVYALNRTTDIATRLSSAMNGNGVYGWPDGISDDGKYALFDSSADNIVPGDTNGAADVFWTDLATGATSRLDVDPAGDELVGGSDAGLLSGDGDHILFVSHSTHVVYNDGFDGSEVFETTLDGGLAANVEAVPASRRVALKWRNPRHHFGGVIVRGSRGRHTPKCPSCGFAVYRGRGHHAVSAKLHNGTIYRYAVFTKNARGKVISRKVAAAKPHAARHHKHHK